MSEHPISGEALPTVLEAWAYARGEMGDVFTIRESLWVARLYAVFQGKGIEEIARQAMRFAKDEMQARLLEKTGWEEVRDTVDTLGLYRDSRKTPITGEKAKAIMQRPHLGHREHEKNSWPSTLPAELYVPKPGRPPAETEEQTKGSIEQPSNHTTQRDE